MRYLIPLGFLVFAVVLVAVPLMADNEYELRLFMLFLIYGMIAVGLNVLVGLTGLVSLGQAGLFALGSYTGAILATRLGFDIVASCIGRGHRVRRVRRIACLSDGACPRRLSCGGYHRFRNYRRERCH